MEILNHLQSFIFNKLDNFKKLYLNQYHIGYINLNNNSFFKDFFKEMYIESDDCTICLPYGIDVLNFDVISALFNDYAVFLSDAKIIKLKNEHMSLVGYCNINNTKAEIAKIDRNLLPIVGAKAYGIHINCYCEIDGKIFMWIAKRSPWVTEPNLWDNMVAGAISYGDTKYDTVFKEANEEAGIEHNMMKSIIYNISLHYKLSYNKLGYHGLKNDAMNIFSLLLPKSFTPIAKDGEVSQFKLVSLDELEQLLVANIDNFKYNSSVAMLYFLLQKHNFKLLNDDNIVNIKRVFDKLYN